jgi:hypothetical protein
VPSNLNEEKIHLLDDIGFIWGPAKVEQIRFDERLEQCIQFRRGHGHLHIPKPIKLPRKPPAMATTTSGASSESEEGDNFNDVEQVEENCYSVGRARMRNDRS